MDNPNTIQDNAKNDQPEGQNLSSLSYSPTRSIILGEELKKVLKPERLDI